jgi:hypothetical protein
MKCIEVSIAFGLVFSSLVGAMTLIFEGNKWTELPPATEGFTFDRSQEKFSQEILQFKSKAQRKNDGCDKKKARHSIASGKIVVDQLLVCFLFLL